jgi:hypothetical protein
VFCALLHRALLTSGELPLVPELATAQTES